MCIRDSYDYDAFGNLVRERRGTGQKLITEYQYDSQHRLIAASLPDGRPVQYRYDAFGRRIAKTVDGQTTEFLWQGDRLIAESGPAHYRSYVYEPGTFRPLALLQGEGESAEPIYYQLDHLGTPQELTSAGGQILWSVKYRAYGSLAKVEVAEIDNPLRFQGQYFDAETGLHYNRHRYYNPGTGSFLTPDPIKLAGGLNNYQYVKNPIEFVDPLGLASTQGVVPGCKQKVPVSHTPSGNLDWSGTDPHGLSRADHVRRHGADDPSRQVPHGVFADEPIKATEDAWGVAKRDGIQPYTETPGNGNWIYDVPYPDAGIQGGAPGAAAGNPILNMIRIVVKPNSNQVVTAFPI